MAIYPRNQHLRIPMIYSSLLGIFPSELMFQQNETLQKLYLNYSRIMLGYYILFLISAYIKLFQILLHGGRKMDEISGNLCITLIYTITVIRQLIMKIRNGFRNLLRDIIETENEIFTTNDKQITKIFNKYVKITTSRCNMYLFILLIITSLYIIKPMLSGPYILETDNTSTQIIVRALPLSSWLPFDDQAHYLVAYIWGIFNSLIGASFVTYTDIIMFSLIIYPAGQLEILNHCLENFDNYKVKLIKSLNLYHVDDEAAAIFALRYYIIRHKKIIKYIDEFNDSMSALMVFDFLQSSLQVASILGQVVGNEITLLLLLFVGAFFVGMILRLYVYYYHANDIILLSTDVSTAIWNSNWYELSSEFQRMIIVFMVRAQKSLKLFIGPFGVMSLAAFISILRATYSYMMLMYSVN